MSIIDGSIRMKKKEIQMTDFTQPGFYRTRSGRKAEVLYTFPSNVVVPPGFYTKDYLLNHIKEATELYRAVIRQLVQDSRYE